LNAQVAIVEDVIPKLMEVEAEPPSGGVQEVSLALEVPVASTDGPHGPKTFTAAVLITSAYDGQVIERLRNAIARNRRMAPSGIEVIHPGAP
jgi:hypothetical protein